MTLISHRGNLSGPCPAEENSISYIEAALRRGFNVELDLRTLHGKLFLGHDTPDYEVTFNWLYEHSSWLFIHCKNYEAIKFISETRIFNWFCHQNDTFGLVSNGMVWYSDLASKPNKNCILPLLTQQQIKEYPKEWLRAAGGICSDYIQDISS